MTLTKEQVTKLKVAEIREELKKRGLDQTGSKATLIGRLTEHIEQEVSEPETAAGAGTRPPEGEGTVGESVKEAETDAGEKEKKAKGVGSEEDGEIKPKHAPIVYNILTKDAEAMKADEEAKKKRRAERFGIVDQAEHEAKKLKARSERFNVSFQDNEAAKMEQRAKRFAQSPSGESTAKKGASGVIDLSHIVTSSAVSEEEKKRRRAERFGASKK